MWGLEQRQGRRREQRLRQGGSGGPFVWGVQFTVTAAPTHLLPPLRAWMPAAPTHLLPPLHALLHSIEVHLQLLLGAQGHEGWRGGAGPHGWGVGGQAGRQAGR